MTDWSEPYRETRFDGKVLQIRKRPCDCECHIAGNAIMHFMPCCKNGWVYQNKFVIPLGTRRNPFEFILPKSLSDILKEHPYPHSVGKVTCHTTKPNSNVFSWYIKPKNK